MIEKFFNKSSKDTFYRPEPTFAEEHFNVTDYLGNGVFYNRHGLLGRVFEIEFGIYDEPLTEKDLSLQLQKYNRIIRDILSGFPMGSANTIVQVICSQRIAEKHEPLIPRTNAGKILAKEMEYIEQLGLIQRRFFLAVLWNPKSSFLQDLKENLKVSLSDSPTSYLDRIESEKKQFLKHLKVFENDAELPLTVLNDRGYLSYINSVLNRGKNQNFDLGSSPFHNLGKNICSEELYGSPEGLDFEDGGNIRSFYWSELPAYFANGRLKTFLSKIPAKEFDICWTMSHGEINLKMEHGARLLWFSRGPAFQDHKKDWENVAAKVNGLNPYGKLSLSLNIFDATDEVETAISKSSIIYLGVRIKKEKRHGPQMIARSLPLNTSQEENGIQGRYTTKSLDTTLGFIPVYDGPKGKGLRLWMNNRGFPTRFNVFMGELARAGFVLGKMGAGKSVLNGSLILEFKEAFPNGMVRVIDRKTSYEKLCDITRGKLVSFSAEDFKERPFSPFANTIWEEDDIALVRSFLCSSISLLNPEAKLGTEHTEILDEALKICANKQEEDLKWSKETGNEVPPHFVWNDVKNNLEVAAENKNQKDMSIVHELLRWTSAFDKTGSYGFLFCSYESRETEESNDLVVYDLGNIQDGKLKTMAAQLVAMKVTRDLSKIPSSIPKFVVFEELGVYLTGDNAKTQEMANRFVKEITKTVRKIGGIPYGITNAVEDFLETPGGISFLRQSTTMIFLPFTDSMIGSLRKAVEAGEIDLNEADLDIISSLHIVDGQYSQAYIISTVCDYKGVINMPLSPGMYALLNNSPSQRTRYKELLAEGNDPANAIDRLASEFIKKRGKS